MVDDASEDGEALRAEARGRGRALPAPRRPTAARPPPATTASPPRATSSSRASTPTASRARAGWRRCCRTSPTRSSTRSRPRIVALRRGGTVPRSRATRPRAPARPRRRRPRARDPVRARAVRARRGDRRRRHLRFDETLRGGEDVEFCWRVPYVRYEPAAQVAHDHRTDPRAWLERRVYYGTTAAGIAKRHPGKARPLHVSPWTTAAWLALAARRPLTAIAITAAATALLARELEDDVPTARHRDPARGRRHAALRPRRRRRAHPPLVAAVRARGARRSRERGSRSPPRSSRPAQAPRRPRVRLRPVARAA